MAAAAVYKPMTVSSQWKRQNVDALTRTRTSSAILRNQISGSFAVRFMRLLSAVALVRTMG